MLRNAAPPRSIGRSRSLGSATDGGLRALRRIIGVGTDKEKKRPRLAPAGNDATPPALGADGVVT
ncbi:MAG TPA: hypothetical protein DCQ98_14770 [Planctomycetaceae bacterium]|nr:hypothetical protein [Planctomycetaceae bacterium]